MRLLGGMPNTKCGLPFEEEVAHAVVGIGHGIFQDLAGGGIEPPNRSRQSEEYQIIRSAPTASAKAWSWRAAVCSAISNRKPATRSCALLTSARIRSCARASRERSAH